MPISGLLITLDRDSDKRARALAALQHHHAIDIGEGRDHRVPVVVDTPSSDEDRAVWDWLHEQPGITFVDVVYVHFDQDQSSWPWHESMKAAGASDPHTFIPCASMPFYDARGKT